ncbi:unnamed protein product [Rotaria socialis]|uniref:G-protein coupled receptors family 1 profile domain-containing protein n=1 Tax=Rotaria socialis TaxID=392032 RepID=A0A821K5L5_9BILA|nr:unnamed protein product [Rotaria socialis]
MSTWTRKKDPAPYETAEYIIGGIIPIFLIVVGTVGNLASIIVLLKKENRKTSTNIYLMLLCLVDTISLYQWNLSRTVDTLTYTQQTIWGASLVMCKLRQFFAFYSLHTSAMFLTFVEFDRTCLLRTVLALNGFLFGLDFEYSTYHNSTGEVKQFIAWSCSLNVGLDNFYAIAYSSIHLVIMYFLPFGVIIICTLLTVKKLFVRLT